MNSKSDISDQEIIDAIVKGNKDLYREIVSRYKEKVYSVAYKIAQNPKDAEDITQEVFLQAYRSLAQYRFDSSFSTWLYKISVNKGLDWKRKNKMREKENLFEENQFHALVDHTEDAYFENDMKLKMHQLLQTIPEIYKSVVILYYFEHLTYQQIAHRLGITSKTVESRLYRAKKIMKEKLIKEGVQ